MSLVIVHVPLLSPLSLRHPVQRQSGHERDAPRATWTDVCGSRFILPRSGSASPRRRRTDPPAPRPVAGGPGHQRSGGCTIRTCAQMRPTRRMTRSCRMLLDYPANDPAIASWFLAEGDRANSATDLRTFTTGNVVCRWWTAAATSPGCAPSSRRPRAGDQVYFLDFRGDLDERLDGPGSEIGEVLGQAARRKGPGLRPRCGVRSLGC